MQQRNLTTSIFLGFLTVLGLAVPLQRIKSAPVDYPVSIYCLPENTKTDIVGAFVQVSGEALTVHCDVSATDKNKDLSAFILGKQVFEGRDLSTTGSVVMLKGNETASVALTFPAVFQGGEYQYTFSLQENGSGRALAHESYLLGSVEVGQTEARITGAKFDRERYAWQDSFRLTVNIDQTKAVVSEKTLFLHVTLDDMSGKECAVLMEKQIVTSGAETVIASFPTEGTCANQVTVSLRGSDNEVLDQKILAVGLPEKRLVTEGVDEKYLQVFGKVPRPLLIFLIFTGTLVLGIGGAILMRRRSS